MLTDDPMKGMMKAPNVVTIKAGLLLSISSLAILTII